ncbi:alpha/beta hydrolase [Geothrix sp. 21YS21S-2]|uniref:alpha/beta hydrolase n=1 Tax=Geothrix sp. 21YS21S-2 TaxID=3068893 RepID=UPI0027BA6105|nr:alpha/beta fold hydrolase [Geothrix sp. 21YS21S-2]
MKRLLLAFGISVPAGVILLNLVVGWALLPPMLLDAPMPARTEAERSTIRAGLCPPGCAWTSEVVSGGEGRALVVWRLHRPGATGVAVLLHGFGDDAWGGASRLRDLPELDAVTFTFRNRDLEPGTPSTLGGWEREDAAAVVRHLASQGMQRNRIVLVGTSQGAGVGLMALERLEAEGPLGGALLESPFESLQEAGRNHLRGTLGAAEWLMRPGEGLALAKAGRLAHFRPADVSPLNASRHLRTPIALLAGDADDITPLEGVRAIASSIPDLTVVHGARHTEAGAGVPGGWSAWARSRLETWGVLALPSRMDEPRPGGR